MTDGDHLDQRSEPDRELLTVTFDKPASGVLAAHLSGELDLSTAPTLDTLIEERLSHLRPRRLVLDLAHLRFIDLRGVAVLTRTLQRTAARNTRLYLASVPPNVIRVLKIADALTEFTQVPDVSGAMAAPSELVYSPTR